MLDIIHLLEQKKNYENYINKIINTNIKFKDQPILAVNVIYKNLGEYSLLGYINTIIHYCLLVEALPLYSNYVENLRESRQVNIEKKLLDEITFYNKKLFQWSLNFLEAAFSFLELTEAECLFKEKKIKEFYHYWQNYIINKKGYSKHKYTPTIQVVWNLQS
ncbi:MAG: hypothetical protein ACFBSE_16010 [Prochloraceae cyanobacterium]